MITALLDLLGRAMWGAFLMLVAMLALYFLMATYQELSHWAPVGGPMCINGQCR